MQVTDQLGDALFLLAHPDISISYEDTDSHMKPHTYIQPHTPLRQALKRMTEGQPVFLVSSHPYKQDLIGDRQVTAQWVYESKYDVFDGYIYRLKPLPTEP
jgi:hypothetical protein